MDITINPKVTLDVYIYDTCGLTVKEEQSDNILRLERAILLAIYVTSRPMDVNEPIPQEEMAMLNRLIADAGLEDKKTILIKQISDLDTKKDWIDWIGKYSDEISNNFSEITSDYLGGVISSIQVKPKFGKNRDNEDKQVGHILKINFRYPIVNDSIEYNDDTNKRKGYRVVNGKKSTSETLTINTGGRGKKKHVPKG